MKGDEVLKTHCQGDYRYLGTENLTLNMNNLKATKTQCTAQYGCACL
jgi:hypothetical protein